MQDFWESDSSWIAGGVCGGGAQENSQVYSPHNADSCDPVFRIHWNRDAEGIGHPHGSHDEFRYRCAQEHEHRQHCDSRIALGGHDRFRYVAQRAATAHAAETHRSKDSAHSTAKQLERRRTGQVGFVLELHLEFPYPAPELVLSGFVC